MDWESVSRDECEALGLSPDGQKKPKRASLDNTPEDIKRAKKQLGPGYAEDLAAWANGEGF